MLPSHEVRWVLKLFLYTLAACFLIEWSVACFARLNHLPYPYTTPLFDPAGRLSDWYDLLPRAKHFGEAHLMRRQDLGLAFQYPLPSFYPFVLFARLFRRPTLAYVIFSVLVWTGAATLFSLALRRRGYDGIFQLTVWATLLLGFPAAFLIDRGNVEIFLLLGVLLGLLAFIKRRPYLAATLFAIPACMKIYPALFLLMLVARRQYKAFALGVAVAAMLSVGALANIGPSIPAALDDMAANARTLRDLQIVAVSKPLLLWDHSLFSLEKRVVFSYEKHKHGIAYASHLTFERSGRFYSLLAPLAFLALYFLRLRRMPLFNQLAAFTLCAVLLPYISYEYTLVYLYLVWACLLFILAQDVSSGRLSLEPGRLRKLVLCFALALVPMSALTLERYDGQVRSLILLALLFAVLTTPIPSTLFGDLHERPGVAQAGQT